MDKPQSMIEIKKTVFVVLAMFPHMKRRYLLREAFPKTPYQLQLLCAKLLFQHYKTFVNFGWDLV